MCIDPRGTQHEQDEQKGLVEDRDPGSQRPLCRLQPAEGFQFVPTPAEVGGRHFVT